MSFASTKNVIQVYQQDLSDYGLPENMVHVVFEDVLPKGVYFLSYSPYMMTTNVLNIFETIQIWIGSGFSTTDEFRCANVEVTPYNYYNMAYFTPSMSGIFVSDGVLPLVISVSASTTNAGTYGAYVSTVGSYDFNYIRLS